LLLAFSIKPSEPYDQRYQQRDFSVECFVTYLKQENINDEFFNNVRLLYSLTEACLKGVDFEKEQITGQVKSNLQYDNNRECLTELLSVETYKNLLLKIRAVQLISESVVSKIGNMWSGKKSPKQQAIERVEKEAYDFFTESEMNCNLKTGFEELFDSFFEFENEENNFVSNEDVEEFCIKKELADQQIIDPVQYNIKMYPKNIKVDNLDCSKILEPLKRNMIASLKDFQSENFKKSKSSCALSTLQDGNDYFNLMLKMELFSKISLNVEQKQEEKKKFVDKMIKVSLKVHNDCNHL
jgi:hypothetical protein